MNEKPYIIDETANLITIRDPMILVDGDTYYLTGTQPPYWKGVNDGVRLWSSKDLKKWTDHGLILKREDMSEEFWGRDRFWAPELFKTDNGKYLLTFNSRNESEEHPFAHGVGLAVADHATGPYTIITTDAPLSVSIGSANDGTIFRDDDGTLYIGFTAGRQLTLSILNPETGNISGTRIVCDAGQEGEWDSIGVEGQCIVKRCGMYFQWYSSWTTGYAAGILTAKDIHGPWVKCPDNPVLSAGVEWHKGGHNHCFHALDGRDYITFHANMKDPSDGDLERFFILPVEYTPEGRVIVGKKA